MVVMSLFRASGYWTNEDPTHIPPCDTLHVVNYGHRRSPHPTPIYCVHPHPRLRWWVVGAGWWVASVVAAMVLYLAAGS